MTATTEPYALEQPTASDLVGSLCTIVGPGDGDAALGRALREIGATRDALERLELPELLQLALALTRQRGLVAVIGRSFSIRVRTFIELHTKLAQVEP